MSANKTLILPLEIPRRELDARIIHGLCAARRGWQVIIGSKALINRTIWKVPRGVYLFTTFTAKRLFMARFLKAMGFLSQGWDEEGLVYADPDLYLDRRVSAETLEYIDQVFAWGQDSAELLNKVLQTQGRRAISLGNPRMDLLRPPFNRIYQEEAERIKEKYGRFILLNTNFPSVNFIEKQHDYGKVMKRPENRQKYESFREYRRFMFQEFMRVLPKLAESLPEGVGLAIRPHPAEDPRPWQDVAERVKNVWLASDGGVVPWLFAAEALVHCDCTTAVEASVIGIPVIAFMPGDDPVSIGHSLPNDLSHRARTDAELLDLVYMALHGTLPSSEEQRLVLHAHIAALEGQAACERAVLMAEELLAENAESPPVARNLVLRSFGALRYLWKTVRPNHRTDAYINKVFPPMPLERFRDRVRYFEKILNVERPVEISAMGRNVFVMKHSR